MKDDRENPDHLHIPMMPNIPISPSQTLVEEPQAHGNASASSLSRTGSCASNLSAPDIPASVPLDEFTQPDTYPSLPCEEIWKKEA